MPNKNTLLALTLLAGSTSHSLASIIPKARDVAVAAAAGPPWPVEASQLPAGWNYTGCFIDSRSDRVLTGAYQGAAFYSRVETCISFCTNKGMPVVGLEYGGECYCAIQLPPTAVSDSDGCTTPCNGNATQACGAADRLSVYSGPGSLVPVVNPGVGGFASIGCYTDNVNGRTLGKAGSVPGDGDAMTNALCAEACQGNAYYGVEYGGECYCDDAIRDGAGPAAAGECNMPCNGNRTELCGGSNRLNLYSKSPEQPTTTTSTTSPTSVPTPPSNSCPAGKSVNLCCVAIEPWKTNTAVWGGQCGYYPADPNSLTGASCKPKQDGVSCASGTKAACCAGTWPGACSLGTECVRVA